MERVSTLKTKDDEIIVNEEEKLAIVEENPEIENNETDTEPPTVVDTENTLDIPPTNDSNASNNATQENN